MNLLLLGAVFLFFFLLSLNMANYRCCNNNWVQIFFFSPPSTDLLLISDIDRFFLPFCSLVVFCSNLIPSSISHSFLLLSTNTKILFDENLGKKSKLKWLRNNLECLWKKKNFLAVNSDGTSKNNRHFWLLSDNEYLLMPTPKMVVLLQTKKRTALF